LPPSSHADCRDRRRLTELAGEGGRGAAAVYTATATVKDLCGIGPTLGFMAPASARGSAKEYCLHQYRGERGLTEQETGESGRRDVRSAAPLANTDNANQHTSSGVVE